MEINTGEGGYDGRHPHYQMSVNAAMSEAADALPGSLDALSGLGSPSLKGIPRTPRTVLANAQVQKQLLAMRQAVAYVPRDVAAAL